MCHLPASINASTVVSSPLLDVIAHLGAVAATVCGVRMPTIISPARYVRWTWCVLLSTLLLTALPAQACGCGMDIPREGDTSVPQERALIRWDRQTDDSFMSLSVEGAARDAAWIVPVPSRATVHLADATLFAELEDLTKPAMKVEWGIGGTQGDTGSAPGSAAVTVRECQTIGPFNVSNLAATDVGALRDWLTAHGYRVPARLDTVLDRYVDRN